MEGLDKLFKDLNVRSSNLNTKDVDARRIAIACTNLAIDEAKIDPVAFAPFVERDIYEKVLDMKLKCDQLPEEKVKRKQVGKTFNPLKLSFEAKGKMIKRKYNITTKIVEKLATLSKES